MTPNQAGLEKGAAGAGHDVLLISLAKIKHSNLGGLLLKSSPHDGG